MPAMMLLLYGFALSLDVDHVPMLLYDQDGTAASRSLDARFPGLALLRRDGRGQTIIARFSAASTATPS